jgi:hypothetical protein
MSELKSKPSTPQYRAGWEKVFGEQRKQREHGPTHRAIDVSRLQKIGDNKYEAPNGARITIASNERRL